MKVNCDANDFAESSTQSYMGPPESLPSSHESILAPKSVLTFLGSLEIMSQLAKSGIFQEYELARLHCHKSSNFGFSIRPGPSVPS